MAKPGAAIGMAVGGLLNALATRSTVESIIAMQTAETEGFFLHQRMTPPELRRHLSPRSSFASDKLSLRRY
jgi:hypothetical protein